MDQMLISSRTFRVTEPEMALEKFDTQKTDILSLVRKQMRENLDYGVLPNTNRKTLFQPGAEKLAKFFGLAPKHTLLKEVEIHQTGFYFYTYKCELIHIASNSFVGDVQRSCNSYETKYLFYKDRNGQRIRKTPQQLASEINTYQAMAQKRAFVAAIRNATMATDIFVDDVEGNGETGKTTKEKDPVRVKLISKLHAIAHPRGFDTDTLHQVIAKMYEVDSITKLTNEQIHSLTEKMLANFQEMPEGSKPTRIVKQREVNETQMELSD